jgi:hypothetical protein
MFEALGYTVKRLVRTRIGDLHLGDLPLAHWRPATKAELAHLNSPLAAVSSSRRSSAKAEDRRINPRPKAGQRRAR